jgi:hypothetical protein
MKGGQAILDETEEDRERMLTEAIHKDVQKEGAFIIHADQKRLQLFRHKPGQLDSLKDLNLDELEEMRLAQAQRIKEIEAQLYSGKGGNEQLGNRMREKMGVSSQKDDAETERSFNSDHKDVKSKKSVKIADEEMGPTAGTGLAHPFKSALVSRESRSRPQSADVRRSTSRTATGPVSPRRQIYEAKFDKYLANRQQKSTIE